MLLKVRMDRTQPQYFISTEVDRNTSVSAPDTEIFKRGGGGGGAGIFLTLIYE